MSNSRSSLSSQVGGITILVALMMLVLLTIAAVGMSRNSFREIVISGTSRQGAMARNGGDSGIEWGIVYIDSLHNPSTTGSSHSMQVLAGDLLKGNIYGLAYNVATGTRSGTLPNTAAPQDDLKIPAGSDNGVNIALTCMGKMAMPGTAQTAGNPGAGNTPGAGTTPLTAPDLWAVRADGLVTTGGVTFHHSKEAWISTPPR